MRADGPQSGHGHEVVSLLSFYRSSRQFDMETIHNRFFVSVNIAVLFRSRPKNANRDAVSYKILKTIGKKCCLRHLVTRKSYKHFGRPINMHDARYDFRLTTHNKLIPTHAFAGHGAFHITVFKQRRASSSSAVELYFSDVRSVRLFGFWCSDFFSVPSKEAKKEIPGKGQCSMVAMRRIFVDPCARVLGCVGRVALVLDARYGPCMPECAAMSCIVLHVSAINIRYA